MLTDEQRLAVVRELWAYWSKSGCVHLDQAMASYQREVQERIEQRSGEAAS